MPRDEFDFWGGARFGLTRHGHALCYGVDHGWLLWAPPWLKYAIVAVWNRIGCALLGHDTYGPIHEGEESGGARFKRHPRVCVACCKEWPDA